MNGRLGHGETMRIFPLSSWTEKDVWRYIARERLDVVPLYFAKERPAIRRDGQIFVIDDGRSFLKKGEEPKPIKVRFRTLGCWPVTSADESEADDVDSVLAEILQARNSERQGRLIDHDTVGAMERKKEEGYF